MNKLVLISLIVVCLSLPTERTLDSDLACRFGNFRKKDCGWYGINQQKCEEIDCCWKEDSDPSVPWCFKGLDDTPTIITTTNLSCRVPREKREECGYYGIDKKECESKGCCWITDEFESVVPWCFKGADDSDQNSSELVSKKYGSYGYPLRFQ